MKRTLLLIGFSVVAMLCFSQHPKKAVKAYEAAQKAFVERDYEKALQQLHNALDKDADFAEAWLLQGEIGMETRDFDLAMEGYERSFRVDSMLFPPAALTLAGLYDTKMRYDDEIKVLKWFQKTAPGNKVNDEKAAGMLTNAHFRMEAVARPVDFQPVNLGEGINTVNDEYVNALELTGTELIFTRRYAVEGASFQQEGIFSSHAVDGQWYASTPIEVDPELDDHMGAAFLSQKGDELFFTVCGLDLKTRTCIVSLVKDVTLFGRIRYR